MSDAANRFPPGRERVRALLESALLRIWYETDRPPLWARMGEVIFSRLAAARRLLYRKGLKKSYRVPVPVIVVGNLAVGGTGKTPLVLWLCEWLAARGCRPGIVCRGYRGRSAYWPRQVSADSDPYEVGDEAVLLARRSRVPVWAGPKRADAARALLAQGVDVIVSDDGLQHYALARDVEFVVVDAMRGFGNRHRLPAGPLRESESRLQEADFLVVNGEGHFDQDRWLTMRVRAAELRNLARPDLCPALDTVSGWRVHAVAGIGHPQRFFDTLAALGIEYTPHVFPDHADWTGLPFDFGDDRPVIMTEKDAVKCRSWTRENFWYLVVVADFDPTDSKRLATRLSALLSGDEEYEAL